MTKKEKADLERIERKIDKAIPHKDFESMKDALKRPLGAVSFTMNRNTLMTQPSLDIQIFEIPAGEQLFKLVRKKEMILSFYHFSPGTRAREVLLDLKKVAQCKDLLIMVNWSIEEISLFVTPVGISGGGVVEKGQEVQTKYRAGTNGIVYDIENKGMPHVTVENKIVLQPTALDVWEETLKSVDILMTGKSNEVFHEQVVSNLSIVMIVSGFEVYTKRRFLEIEEEGISPRITKVISEFYSKKERPANIVQIIKEEAEAESISPLRFMVNKNKINFQNFEDCKKAYNKAYRIPFGNIGISSEQLIEIQKYIKYRHRIIHVHPVFGVLNPEKAGSEERVVSDYKLVQKIKKIFELFIETLHQETLKLIPE